MTCQERVIHSHQVLVVSCSCGLSEEENRAAQDHAFSPNIEDASKKMANTRYGCMIAYVDPSKKESIDQLQKLRDLAEKTGIPLATISQFNPVWMGNLMAQLGVTEHFKSFPDESQLLDMSANGNQEEHTKKTDQKK